MAIANYSDLQQSIANFITRDDIATYIPDFIALAEARIVRDLKTSEIEITTTLTVDSASESLPDNFAGMVRAHLGGVYPTLDYLPPDRFHSTYASSVTERPVAYTIEGNIIYFAPEPADSYTMTYTYTGKPDIATDNTNRLLTIYPDIYLFGALAETADFLQDTEAQAKYEGRYQSAIKSANESNQYKGPLSMQLSGVV